MARYHKSEIALEIPNWYPEFEDAYPRIPDPYGWNREKKWSFYETNR